MIEEEDRCATPKSTLDARIASTKDFESRCEKEPNTPYDRSTNTDPITGRTRTIKIRDKTKAFDATVVTGLMQWREWHRGVLEEGLH